MSFRFNLAVVLLLSAILVSCKEKKDANTTSALSQDQVTEKFVEANKAAVAVENDQIEKLILNKGWNMKETGTGLRYQVIEKGKGPKTSIGNLVQIDYEVSLITGELVYSSGQTGTKEFSLGRGGVESGLEEGMLLMNVGDKMRFIIPSYLAHGLAGDQDKIPPKATLIYTVKLINLK